MKCVKTASLFVMILLSLSVKALEPSTENLLFVTDIHFDPLYDITILPKLIDQPVGKWNEVFQSSSKKQMSEYREDTNFPLWQSALKGMKEAVPNPATVLVGGDFFRHTFHSDFDSLYKKANLPKANMKAAYEDFLKKTTQFLVQGLTETFPNAQFIPVIGNNDSSAGDYMIKLQDPFLKDFATAWQQASKNSIPESELVGFASSGHYATTLQHNPKLKIVVGNDIFMTPPYKSSGNSFVPPGQGELQWIDQQITAAEKAGQKVWLVTHVPPGVDVTRSFYKSMMGGKLAMSAMLKDDYNTKYLDMLHRHAKTILMNFAGHNHFAEIRIPGGEVPVVIAPAVSPFIFNNPSFQVYDIDAKNMEIKNFASYSIDLGNEGTAWKKLLDFNQAFQQKEVSLASFKKVASALQSGKQTAEYGRFVGSDGELPKKFFNWKTKAYLCDITEMTVPQYLACLGTGNDEESP